MIQVNTLTLTCADVPVPDFLAGLDAATLMNLTWTDPALGLQHFAWWPVDITDVFYDHITQQVTGYTYVAVPQIRRVTATPVIAPIDPAVVAATLAAAQNTVWTAIKAQRDSREFNGMKIAGDWFHTDLGSQVKYLGLKDKARDVIAAGGAMTDALTEYGMPLVWHTLTNNDAIVTAQLAFDLVAGVAQLQAILFANAKTLKAAMMLLEDPTNFDTMAGWPDSYL